MISPDVSNPAVYQAELDRFAVMQDAAMKLLMVGHVLAAWLRRGDESITFAPVATLGSTSAPLHG